MVDVVRNVTVTAKSSGFPTVVRDLTELEGAQNSVATSADRMAIVTETSSKRQLSASAQYQNLLQRLDPVVRAQTQLERGQGLVNRALGQGVIGASEAASTIGMLEARFLAASRASDTVTKSSGLSSQQMLILGGAARRSFDALAAGSSPMRALAMEAGHLGAAVGEDGVSGLIGGLGTTLKGFITPTTVAIGAVGGIAGAMVLAGKAGLDYQSGQDRVAKSLTGTGRASDATAAFINSVAEASAGAGRVSVSSARDMASAYAATGKIGSATFADLIGITGQYARATGQDLPTATAKMAEALADPVKGAEQLNAGLSFLDGTTLQLIKTLDAQGEHTRAQQVIIAAMRPVLADVTEQTNGWALALSAVAHAAENAYDMTGKAVYGAARQPSLQERIVTEANKPTTVPWYMRLGQDEYSTGTQSRNDDALAYMQEDARRKGLLSMMGQRSGAADDVSLAASKVIDQLTPDNADLLSLQKWQSTLESALSLGKAPTGTEAVLKRVSDLLAAGGTQAFNLSKSARDAFNLVALNSYDRALGEILNKYRDLSTAAGGNATVLAGLNVAKSLEISTLNYQTREAAKGEIAIPGDYLATIKRAESGGDPNAISKSGAVGTYQFTAGTWMEEFTKHLPDLYATMRAQHPEGGAGDAATRAAVLGLRTNPGYQDRMAGFLTQDNAVSLAEHGFDATSRNLYGAHVAGAGGIEALLKAPGSASAQAILDALDPAVTRNNSAIFGGGKSVTQALAELDKRTQGSGAASRGQDDRTRSIEAETGAVGKSAAELARLQSIQEQLDQDRTAGIEVGLRFRTANDLITASSKGLTGELKTQTDTILQNATARARATETQLSTRFTNDAQMTRDALGRSPDEQAVFNQARGYAQPGTEQFSKVSDELRSIQQLTYGKDLTGGALKGIASDLEHGATAATALKNALSRVEDSITNKAIDSLTSSLFGGTTTGGGGILGSLLSTLGIGGAGNSSAASAYAAGQARGAANPGLYGPGFASGGWTGPAAPHVPVGVVHGGEYVFDASSTARIGVSTLEAMRRMPGYAEGGYVGSLPAANSNAPIVVNHNVQNYGGQPVQTSQSRGPNGQINIDTIVGQVGSGLAKQAAGGRGDLRHAVGGGNGSAGLRFG